MLHIVFVLRETQLLIAVSPLEGFGPREWVCFERALVVRDMFLGGERTFLSQEDAREFRSMIYAQYGERTCLSYPDLSGPCFMHCFPFP